MSKIRRAPNKTEKLAAVLLMLKRANGEWLIPEPLRSSGTAEEIARYPEWDHARHAALGGDTKPQNITPRTKADHAQKTNSIDKGAIAKAKRLEKAQAEFRERLLAKGEEPKPPPAKRRAKIPSRPFPKRKKLNEW